MLFRVFRNDAVTNPLYESTEDGEWREKKRFRAFGNIYPKFEPIKGLNFRTQFSPQMLNKTQWRILWYVVQEWRSWKNRQYKCRI